MKTKPIFWNWRLWIVLGVGALSSVGCMTTYDAYGRPVQSVDPGAAVAGAAAAGIVGYAIGQSGDHHHHHHHRGYYGGYHRGRYYR